MDESEFNIAVGAQIRARREAAGMTQTDLGELLGLSRTSVSNIEAGRQPVSAYALHQLAQWLQCDVPDLLPDRRRSSVTRDLVAGEHPDVQRFVADHLAAAR